MAIQIKSMNAYKAMEKLGVDSSLLAWLKKTPVQVTLSATKFRFSVTALNITDYASYEVPVTLNQLQKLNAGTLPAAEQIKLKTQVDNAISEIKKLYGSELEAQETAGEALTGDLNKEAGILSKLPPLNTEPKMAGGFPVFDMDKLGTAPTVKLRDAKMLYQPVMGTSEGSRYFLVAANKDMRVAARYKGGNLSIRVEGPNWKKYTDNMKMCGFDKFNSASDYASIHLNVGDDVVLAGKTLGAVLMGLGVKLDTPVPEIKVISGKGA